MYNGELDVEKMDNWLKQIEVYCKIQNIVDEPVKFQLATLRMGGTALIWWQSKTRDDLCTKGKVITSQFEFTSGLKKQFYPLGYMQEEVMDWQTFKQGKGQSVQEYTQEFRKRAMILGVSLYTQDTLLKYIGGLQEYLKYTILIFNPTNIDEVSVQAIHLETGRKNNNYSVESRQLKEGKDKGKEKMN